MAVWPWVVGGVALFMLMGGKKKEETSNVNITLDPELDRLFGQLMAYVDQINAGNKISSSVLVSAYKQVEQKMLEITNGFTVAQRVELASQIMKKYGNVDVKVNAALEKLGLSL